MQSHVVEGVEVAVRGLSLADSPRLGLAQQRLHAAGQAQRHVGQGLPVVLHALLHQEDRVERLGRVLVGLCHRSPGVLGESRESDGVHLGDDLGAVELRHDVGGDQGLVLLVVHGVDGELAPAVELQFARLPFEADAAGDEPVGAVVVRQAIHGELGDLDLAHAHELPDEGAVDVEERGLGLVFDDLVEVAGELGDIPAEVVSHLLSLSLDAHGRVDLVADAGGRPLGVKPR